jgi:hypothetical protein
MHYKITVYIPQEHCEEVKEAMFKAGAGVIDNYADCAWQVLGKGQFRPLKGSRPFLGEEEKLEEVLEYKVEMFCVAEKIENAIEKMKKAHPYEVPAYGVIKLEDI